jgi:hypothetical protein
MDLEPQGRNLWIGSEFQGLFKWTLEGLESVDFDYPILDLKAKDSSLYIGSEGGGLFEYNGTTLKRISDASLTCYGIAFQNEFLIVSTNNGLLRGTKQKGIWEFENLLTIDESQLALFNRKALLDWDDQLWLGGPGGVVTVRGELRKPPSRILLTEVFVDNEHLRFNVAFDGKADKIVLKPGSKTIQWGFEIMSLGRASGKRLEYRVEGLIDQWTAAVPGQKGIVLSNLVPGDFNLQMRLINERGSVEDQAVVNWKVRAFFWQERKFKIFVFLLVAVITAFLVAVYQDRKMRAVRVKLLETEKELLEVKAREMEAKAKEKSDELGFQLLKTSSRIQVLQELKDRLQEVRKSYGASSEVGSMLQRLLRDLNSELQSENYWDHFERNYNDLNDAFSKQLTERFPDLTKGETRLTYLIRQKMNNKEISNVLNVSPAAVEKAKYRLKKKLNLSKLDSLDQFIDEL